MRSRTKGSLDAAKRRVRSAGLSVAAVVAGLDQVSKAIAREQLAASPVELGPLLNFSLSFNRGVSFGLFAGEAEFARWGLVLAMGAIAAWVLAWLWRESSYLRALALGLIAGGALGNIVDRIRDGAVTDFIDLHLGDAHWPTFNLADSAIVIGVAILVLASAFRTRSAEGIAGLIQIAPLLQRAVAASNAGRWEDAEALARQVLAIQPEDPSALNILGGALMNTRGAAAAVPALQRAAAAQANNPYIAFNLGEALRRSGDTTAAVRAFRRATHLKTDFVDGYAHRGEAHRQSGQWEEAEIAYRKALGLDPAHAVALNGIAFAYHRNGRSPAAIDSLRQALKTPRQGRTRAGLLANLGNILADCGAQAEALEALSEAVDCDPDNAGNWRALARTLSHTKVAPQRRAFAAQLQSLLTRPDVNPRALATAVLAVLRREPLIAQLLAAVERDSAEPQASLVQHAAGAQSLLSNPLFTSLLVSAPIPDPAIERLLVTLRRDLLLQPAAAAGDKDELALICALAGQCFLNEYVYVVSPAEGAAVATLKRAAETELNAGESWRSLALLACYGPLDEVFADALLPAGAPESISRLWRQQVLEPRRERELADAIPRLRPITNNVSQDVRGQYEANPYPRWTRCQRGEPTRFRQAVLSALPHLSPGEVGDIEQPAVLIAGCGTGLETMGVLNTYSGARVVGLDLSLASLAYGQRKLEEDSAQSVRLLQGDILDLDQLSETFDLVESFGVIHHMADPERGLQALARRLRPGGLMRLGLYSEIARTPVIAAREMISRDGYAEDVHGLRSFRWALMTSPALPKELEPVLSPASDFWTTSDCRDLLFHRQEHRFTLVEIGTMLSRAGLVFLGLELRHAADRALFRRDFPNLKSLRSLSDWHAFELRRPETFGETYRLWVKRDEKS